MKKLAIKAENISKQYRLGEVGTGTLSHDLNRFWSKVRGKEDPYLKIGEANNRSSKGESEYVWYASFLKLDISTLCFKVICPFITNFFVKYE